MSGITVIRADERLVAVKRAERDGVDHLRHEAEVLARVEHPGLIQLVELTDTEPLELRTLFAGPDSWDRRPPGDDRTIVEGLASVAAVVADLHDLGITHGRLELSHVVASGDGRPVLCSLGGARPTDEAGRHRDHEGLASLVDALAAGAGSDVAKKLARIAAGCREGSLDARSAARRLGAVETGGSPSLRSRGRQFAALRRRGLVAGAVGLSVVAAIGLVAVGGGASTDSPLDGPFADAPGAGASNTVSPALKSASEMDSSTTVLAPSPSTPNEHEGETVTAGRELVHEGRRYGLGHDDDVVVLGDWNCDDIRTPALLRLDTGTVAVFDEWPPPGGSTEPAVVTAVEGAEALDVVAREVCDQLRVRTESGSQLVEWPQAP